MKDLTPKERVVVGVIVILLCAALVIALKATGAGFLHF